MDLLARALDEVREVHEYVIVQRTSEGAVHEFGPIATRRQFHQEVLRATVFRDFKDGRGSSAFLVAQGEEDTLPDLIDAALDRAEQAVGMPWRMPLPAAPARVQLADEFPRGAPGRAADAIAERAMRAVEGGFRVSRLRVEAKITSTEVRTSRGFASTYDSTTVGLDGTVTAKQSIPGEAEPLRARARRVSDLRVEETVREATQTLQARRTASAPRPAQYDLLLKGDAVSGNGAVGTGSSRDYGWFGPLVAQSDANQARQGLTRYQPGQSIYAHHAVTGDRLTLSSDGTVDFGLLSQPFGELGEPVRRFDLVAEGTASGLALDMREAALRGVTPNGGVRNLVIGSGSTALEELSLPGRARPLIEVRELSWLQANPRTGGFVAELGLGYVSPASAGLPDADTVVDQPRGAVTGGALTGNIFELLARARFSRERINRGWYYGPVAIRIDNLSIK